MKTKKILETVVFGAALMAGQAGAAPISLQGSTITSSYNGSFDGMVLPGVFARPEPVLSQPLQGCL